MINIWKSFSRVLHMENLSSHMIFMWYITTQLLTRIMYKDVDLPVEVSTRFLLRCSKALHSVVSVSLQTAMTRSLFHQILFLCNGGDYLVLPFCSEQTRFRVKTDFTILVFQLGSSVMQEQECPLCNLQFQFSIRSGCLGQLFDEILQF